MARLTSPPHAERQTRRHASRLKRVRSARPHARCPRTAAEQLAAKPPAFSTETALHGDAAALQFPARGRSRGRGSSYSNAACWHGLWRRLGNCAEHTLAQSVPGEATEASSLHRFASS